jgi:hypothetical protein
VVVGKKVETKEIQVEKQSVILSARLTETENRRSAIANELTELELQLDAAAAGERLDTAVVNGVLVCRREVLAEQEMLTRRVSALKEQQKAAEIAEGKARIAVIEAEILRLTGEADESCQECKEILHDLLTAVETLRETLRTRNELSAEAGYLAVACDVPRPHLPPLAALDEAVKVHNSRLATMTQRPETEE